MDKTRTFVDLIGQSFLLWSVIDVKLVQMQERERES